MNNGSRSQMDFTPVQLLSIDNIPGCITPARSPLRAATTDSLILNGGFLCQAISQH